MLECRAGSTDAVRSGCCTEHDGRESGDAEDGLNVGSSTGVVFEVGSLLGIGLDPLGRGGRFERRSVR